MAGDVAKFALRFEVAPDGDADGDGIEMVSTFHVRAVDDFALDEAELAGLNDFVSQWWQVGVDLWDPARASYPSTVRLLDVTSQRIWPTFSDPVIGTLFADHHGTHEGVTTPPQCAFLVRLVTGLDSRRGRGRMYLPPPYDSIFAFTGEIPLDTGQTEEHVCNLLPALAAAVRRFPGDPDEDGPCVLVVWSRLDEDAHAVVSFDVSRIIATQRRRHKEPWTYRPVGLAGV